eukprot:1111461-Alexandrium_andersonii.AAC.1
MSASLVGSEMCIRDSHQTPRDEASHAQRGRVQPWPLPRRHRRSTVEAVSYTHLTLPTICSV